MKKIFMFLTLIISLYSAGQTDSLQTKLTVNGAPGPSSKIRFRCGATITQACNHLFIVDGVHVDQFLSIDPLQIVNITILKSPEAIALFGAAARNGVFIITTKDHLKVKLIILDESDASPVAGASVSVINGKDTSILVADEKGEATFEKYGDKHRGMVEVSSIGYEKKTIPFFSLSGGIIRLRRKVDKMDPVVIQSYATKRCGRCGSYCTSVSNCRMKKLYNQTNDISKDAFVFSVFPNPASSNSKIHLQLDAPFHGKIQVINLAGQVMQSEVAGSGKWLTLRFGLRQLAAGVYVIRLTDEVDHKIKTCRIVIQ